MMTQQTKPHPVAQPGHQPVKTGNRRELSDAELGQVVAAGGRIDPGGANN